ncbi:MAG TPA: helix-turn-helix transcriptional regulator [Actinomycetota bacterium]|nr:helix-turn-helix transcriptional regulator [Actinomycetota bacterium]
MNVRALGQFIRRQRRDARLSLRAISRLAGVSVPYLSQIERGLRRPSAEILQAIARALRISAETLYVKAGLLQDRPVPDVTAAVLADPSITERQKRALLQVYESFLEARAEGGWKRSSASGRRSTPSGPPARRAGAGTGRGASRSQARPAPSRRSSG